MSHVHKDGSAESASWVRKSALFRHSSRVREEIDRHKWLESEKAGHDIGWDRAAVSWMVRHGKNPGKDRT